MLYEVLKYLRNFFAGFRWYAFNTKIENGIIDFEEAKNCRFYLIEGSRYNDGIHKCDDLLSDEVFSGYITELRIPDAVLDIVYEIESWQKTNAEAQQSVHSSESFGGASFTMRTTASGNPVGWQDVFGSRLRAWKKL